MAISRQVVADTLETFIREQFHVPLNDLAFTRDVHLFEEGFVDSVGFVELLAFIESTFRTRLDDGDLFSEDFRTINGISGVVHAALTLDAVKPDDISALGVASL